MRIQVTFLSYKYDNEKICKAKHKIFVLYYKTMPLYVWNYQNQHLPYIVTALHWILLCSALNTVLQSQTKKEKLAMAGTPVTDRYFKICINNKYSNLEKYVTKHWHRKSLTKTSCFWQNVTFSLNRHVPAMKWIKWIRSVLDI